MNSPSDLIVHVGIHQRPADVFDGIGNIEFVDPGLSFQVLKRGFQFFHLNIRGNFFEVQNTEMKAAGNAQSARAARFKGNVIPSESERILYAPNDNNDKMLRTSA